MSADLEDLRNRLVGIADELSELAMARLRDAIEEGATRPPEDEKRLLRARRSIDKAVHLLDEV